MARNIISFLYQTERLFFPQRKKQGNSFASGDLQGLAALRGAACLLVVLYHALPPAGGGWNNGAAGVDLFFVISGFVMTRAGARAASPAVFLRRRLIRIVPLYWLVTSAKIAIALAVPSATPHTRLSLWQVLASFLFLPATDPLGRLRPVLPVGWTLNFELLFYLAFALTLAARLRPLPGMLALLCPLALASLARGAGWPAWRFYCDPIVLEFIAGIAIARFLDRRPLAPPAASILLAAGCAALFVPASPGPMRVLLWGVPAAAIVAGLVALEPLIARRVPLALLLTGEASYAIYLTHGFAIGALSHVCHGGVLVAASLAGSVGLGVFVERFVDGPLRRRVSRTSVVGPRQHSQKFFGSFFQKRTNPF